jgi:cap1 methyltransferase
MSRKNVFRLFPVDDVNLCPVIGDNTKIISHLGNYEKLNSTKHKISDIGNTKWIKIRKLSNPLEYPYDKNYLKNKPVSRAFFKMLEIITEFKPDLQNNTLHLAEAPGGFIQSTIYKKSRANIHNTKHYTFSILGDNDKPVYSEVIVQNKDVFILSNKNNNGDLYKNENINMLISTLSSKKIKFITCDGGITENSNFSSKEQIHHKLIYNQIYCSLFVLENSGDLVVKIFDIFTELTFDYIYILSYLFKEVYIHKPHTSRPSNSEKYIYCKNFMKSKLSEKIYEPSKDTGFNPNTIGYDWQTKYPLISERDLSLPNFVISK